MEHVVTEKQQQQLAPKYQKIETKDNSKLFIEKDGDIEKGSKAITTTATEEQQPLFKRKLFLFVLAVLIIALVLIPTTIYFMKTKQPYFDKEECSSDFEKLIFETKNSNPVSKKKLIELLNVPVLEEKDDNGRTFLFNSVGDNKYMKTKALIAVGANFKYEDRFGKTPIIFAIECGSNNAFYALREAGASYKCTYLDSLEITISDYAEQCANSKWDILSFWSYFTQKSKNKEGSREILEILRNKE